MITRRAFFIDGRWVASKGGKAFTVYSPSTEEPVGEAVLASVEDVDSAVAAARRAFDAGPWPRMSWSDRQAILTKTYDLISPLGLALDRVVALEAGIPIASAPASRPLAQFPYHLSIPEPAPVVRHGLGGGCARISREPVGVVAAIIPWNAPYTLALAKILPALLAGCTVVVKPAPEAPLDLQPLMQAFHDAGLPPGVLNLLIADRVVGEALVRHPHVDKVSFTGSTAGGKRVAAVAAEHVKRVSLELGGKSPAILLDDADLAIAVPAVLRGGMLLNNGEACAAWTRLIAPRSRYAEIVDAICDYATAVRIGDAVDPATEVGPLVAERQRERVEGYIALGQQEGAKVALGGGRPSGLDRGWFVEPTVLVDVDNAMRVAQEEIFGPVACVIPYDTEEHAIAIANDSPFGLSAAVFTADTGHGTELAARLRTGGVGVNCLGIDLAYPFGGFKQSGVGRQFGHECLHDFLEYHSVAVPAGQEMTQ